MYMNLRHQEGFKHLVTFVALIAWIHAQLFGGLYSSGLSGLFRTIKVSVNTVAYVWYHNEFTIPRP